MHGHSIWKVSRGEVVAASFVACVPIRLIFLVLQRHFVGGLHVGRIEG